MAEFNEFFVQGMALLGAGKMCIRDRDYDRVLKICEYAEFKHFIFPELMEVKLKAFYEVKQYSQAITYYHKIVELYSSTFNIELTPNITNIHHELLKFHKDEMCIRDRKRRGKKYEYNILCSNYLIVCGCNSPVLSLIHIYRSFYSTTIPYHL